MKKEREGFTLVEVLVAVTIMSVIVTIAMKVYIDFLNAWGKSAEKMALFKEARFVLNRIEKDLEGSIAQWSDISEKKDFLKKKVLVLQKHGRKEKMEEIKYFLKKNEKKELYLIYRMDTLIGENIKEFKMRFRYRNEFGKLQWTSKAPVPGELVYVDIGIATQGKKSKIQKFERRVLVRAF